ncbi:MAG: hypothetical protein R3Y68_01835 [Rikenellaceae bacterium]
MESKLQELTQKLYDEGLQRGRSEADEVVAKAKSEAAKIVESAEAEAKRIVAEAEAKAADMAKNSLTEISMAGRQALTKIKAEIENVIVTKSIEAGVKSANVDGKFISEMMLAIAKGWSGADSGIVSLAALLPEAQKSSLDAAIKKSAAELLKAGVEVGYSSQVKSGFKIGEKGGGYYISFSDDDFDGLMRVYLRERVSDLLFKA